MKSFLHANSLRRRLGGSIRIVVGGWLLSATAWTAEFRNGTPANLVVGQPDFAGVFGKVGGSTGFRGSVDAAVDPVTGKLFVVDRTNNRVLRFASAASLQNGAAAEAVLGQADFAGTARATNAVGLWDPQGIFVDATGRLWLADRTNGRVLMWRNAGTLADGAPADLVLGKPGFEPPSEQLPRSASTLSQPTDVFVDASDTLWVSDIADWRVLRYDNVSAKQNGAAADGVLGQPDFATKDAQTGARAILAPLAVTGDALGNLYVVDALKNRVLRFANARNLPNGGEASAVFGQADFEATGFATTRTALNQPYGATVGPDGALWVADTLNRRVVRYPSPATATFAPAADLVLGKPDFTTDEGKTGAAFLAAPMGLCVDNTGNVWVADCDNSRVIRFSPAADPPAPRPVVLSREPRRMEGSQLPFRLTGRALHATKVYSRRGVAEPFPRKGRIQEARLAGENWSLRVRVPERRRIILRVWAVGPGGRSRPLTFILTRDRE